MFGLQGKTAIISGATKGLGRAMAEAMAGAGAAVAVVSRNAGDCARVAGELQAQGGSALACPCDVTDPGQVEGLVQQAVERFGRIDILVNNAGTSVTKASADLTLAEWDAVMDTNLKAAFILSQAVGRRMIARKGGRIVNIASMLGLVGNKETLPYTSSKGGLIQLTRALALEWARHGITVNALAPGYVVTAMNKSVMEDPRVADALLRRIPLRRFGTEQEIAAAVVFLASDAAAYMTGSVLTMDGGWTAQ